MYCLGEVLWKTRNIENITERLALIVTIDLGETGSRRYLTEKLRSLFRVYVGGQLATYLFDCNGDEEAN